VLKAITIESKKSLKQVPRESRFQRIKEYLQINKAIQAKNPEIKKLRNTTGKVIRISKPLVGNNGRNGPKNPKWSCFHHHVSYILRTNNALSPSNALIKKVVLIAPMLESAIPENMENTTSLEGFPIGSHCLKHTLRDDMFTKFCKREILCFCQSTSCTAVSSNWKIHSLLPGSK